MDRRTRTKYSFFNLDLFSENIVYRYIVQILYIYSLLTCSVYLKIKVFVNNKLKIENENIINVFLEKNTE